MAIRGNRLTVSLLVALVLTIGVGSAGAVAISRHGSDQAEPVGSRVVDGSSSSAVSSMTSSASGPSADAATSAAIASSAAPSGPSTNLTVQLTAAVRSHPRVLEVQQLLQTYFDAINQHNYDSWTQVVTADLRDRQNGEQWLQAYATTVDSSIWINRIQGDPMQVSMAFTSQQDPDLAPKDLAVACIQWTLTYQLAEEDGQLVVGSTSDVGKQKCG